jgi:hypothetical protein
LLFFYAPSLYFTAKPFLSVTNFFIFCAWSRTFCRTIGRFLRRQTSIGYLISFQRSGADFFARINRAGRQNRGLEFVFNRLVKARQALGDFVSGDCHFDFSVARFCAGSVNDEWIFGGFEAKCVAYVCLLFALDKFSNVK